MRTFTFMLFSVFSVYLLLTNNFSNSSKLLNSIVQNSSNFPNSREQTSKKIASLRKKINTQMSIYHIFQLYLLIIGFILLLYASYLELCNHVIYLPYNTNLTLFRKHIRNYSNLIKIIPLGTIIILIIAEHPEFLYNLIPKIIDILFRFVLFLVQRNRKNVQILLFVSLTLYIFQISNEPSSQTFCLLIFQISSSRFLRITPWLPKLLIIIANDIHVNPGPHYQNTFFTFMTWNVNSLAKNDFQRVQLIEAHNSIFNYDLISICETALNDSIELPKTLLSDYTFIHSNNPNNTKHGRVGLFFNGLWTNLFY